MVVLDSNSKQAWHILTVIKRLVFGSILYNGDQPAAGAADFVPPDINKRAMFDFHWDPFLYHAAENLNAYQRMHLKAPPGYDWDEDFPVCGDGRLQENEQCECHVAGNFNGG